MMRPLLAVLTAVALLGAAPASFKGGPDDLNKAVDARGAKLGMKVVPADEPFATILKRVPRKGSLVRVAFNDIGPIRRENGHTVFVGRHAASGIFDFAMVIFPGDVEISTRASSVVIGSFTGRQEIPAADGKKVTVPVIAARVVGVIDGGVFTNGRPSFAPGSPIRVYEKKS